MGAQYVRIPLCNRVGLGNEDEIVDFSVIVRNEFSEMLTQGSA